MAIFAIFRTSAPEALGLAIAAEYPESHLHLGGGEWLVATSATAREVSDRIGLSGGDNGAGIVVTVSGYFGRAPAEMWDWINAKAEHPHG